MSRIIGNKKEIIALQFLHKNGLKLLTRNFHSRFGEIDLIMEDGETIVFVEVRYRRSARFGTSAESIDYHKQQRLIKTAQFYLLRYPHNKACRFDVIAIDQSLQWIRNAFS
ncbi:MAG: YraN family protein [Gammaproteobacteria bacterium]|nr:YraN family protein [Gammaproteobacteria bacterium]